MLTLARTSVVEAFASADGALSIAFADGTRIKVPPDPAFEAWGMGGPGGMRVISTPGGELVVWKYLPRP